MSVVVVRIAPPPWQNFEGQGSFRERMAELKESRRRALAENPHKPLVAISGAGPAGLSRAINALVNGNPVKVVEKRTQEDSRRENTVLLQPETIEILTYYGIYPYLLEKGLIFSATRDTFEVRLKDLEQAMKAVVAELTSEPVIQYDSKIEQIVSRPGAKVAIVVKNSAGQQTQINNVDLLVVAEGAHSPTNETLLRNRRISVLPSLPVIAAIFKDDRPAVSSLPTLFQYVSKTVLNTATAVYYYAIFLFKFTLQRQHFFNPDRQIAGSLILKTPGQNYLGAGLSKLETEKMVAVCKKLKDVKAALEAATLRRAPTEEIARLTREVAEAQSDRDAFLNYWAGVSFCFANALKIAGFFFASEPLKLAQWLPVEQVNVAEIGADKSSAYSGTIEGTAYLIAGDTLATVDPVTGLGCNSAVSTTLNFHRFLKGLDSGHNIPTLLNDYNFDSESIVSRNHSTSKRARQTYRPDALGV